MKRLNTQDRVEIGGFRLESPLGTGGMGEVFLAISRGGRRVALKRIRADVLERASPADREAMRARFRREIEMAKRLLGCPTAQFVAAGPEAETPWMALEYLDGQSLEELVGKQGRLNDADLRSLAAGLAEALAAIHAQGVVHRDIKPSNLIMTPNGVRLIDYGVSKHRDDTRLTKVGTVLGTDAYMSPEQAGGWEVGPPGDVYAMARVLTYAMTGRTPLGRRPPAGNGQPPGPLDRLVAACLADNPAQRPTARQVLAEIAPSALRTLPDRRDPGRRRLLRAGALLGACAVGAGALKAVDLLWPDAEAPAAPLRTYAGLPDVGNSVAFSAVGGTAAYLATGSRYGTVHLWNIPGGMQGLDFQAHWDAVCAVAFHPVVPNILATASFDSSVRVWDVSAATPARLALLQHPQALTSVGFDSSGHYLVTGAMDGRVRVWQWQSVQRGALLTSAPASTWVTSVAYALRDRSLVAGYRDGTVRLMNAQNPDGTPPPTLYSHGAWVTGVAWQPGADGVVSGGTDGYIRVWNTMGSGSGFVVGGGYGSVDAVAFDPQDPALLFSAHGDRTVRRWSIASGGRSAGQVGDPLTVISGPARALAVSPDGAWLATYGHDDALSLWQLPADGTGSPQPVTPTTS